MSNEPTMTTVPAEPLVANCPRCRAQLRLTRPPVQYTPIKCFQCQAMFCLEPIDTVPADPTSMPNVPSSPLPGSRSAAAAASLPPLTLPPTPPAIAPTMTFSVPPPPAPAAPAKPGNLVAGPTANAGASRSSATSSPAPAPGLPNPNAAAKKPQLMLDLGPMESIIAVALTLVLVLGAIVGGYYVYRSLSPAPTHDSASTLTNSPTPVNELDQIQSNMNAGPITTPRLPNPPANAEEKSQALIGYWVSRADDGSVAILDLQKEGVAVYTGATADPREARGLLGRWALVQQEKNEATIDILYSVTGLELHRITLQIVSPECILVTRSAFRGIVDHPDQRFIRTTRPET
jgi:hypothetical protein